jgi:uncharacterized protein
MAVAALEDYLFICYEQLRHGTGCRKTIRPILLASFFTSLTTMAGFGSLYFTDMLIMARFGLWAAFGSMVQWLACFIILPALMERFKGFRKLADPTRAFRPEIADRILDIPLNRRWARGLLVIIPLGMYTLFNLHISGAPKDMMTADHPFIQGLSELKNSRGWEGVVHVVFAADQDPQTKVQVLEKLESLPNVQRVLSLEKIEDFAVKGLSLARKELVLTDLESTDLYKSYISKTGRSKATLYVKDTATEPMMKLLEGINQECQGRCFGTSESAAHAEFSAKVPEAFISSFGLSMALVSLILIALVRFLTVSPRPYFSILVSSMWGPFFVLTLFWLFNTKINFMACLFTSVLIGLTGDNAIQFLFTSRKKNLNTGLSRRGGGSILISLIIAMSCMVFWGSYFVSPRVYGMFLAVGIIAATFGDVWILKAFQVREKS